jgi:hypothetical protein
MENIDFLGYDDTLFILSFYSKARCLPINVTLKVYEEALHRWRQYINLVNVKELRYEMLN